VIRQFVISSNSKLKGLAPDTRRFVAAAVYFSILIGNRSDRTRASTMILALPGGRNRNAPCARPLGLIDIYPTLIEICGLPSKKSLQGRSLSPLLKDPTREWDYPALTTRHPGNHAVRSEYCRYIRYANGDEELVRPPHPSPRVR